MRWAISKFRERPILACDRASQSTNGMDAAECLSAPREQACLRELRGLLVSVP